MKRLLLVWMLTVPTAQAMSIEMLACGAKICLGGDGGSPCSLYLDKYNSIEGPTKAITERLRKVFLLLCPEEDEPDYNQMAIQDASELKQQDAAFIETKKISEKHYEDLFKRMREESGPTGVDSDGGGHL